MDNRDEQKDLAILERAFFDELLITQCEFGGIGLDCKRPFGNSSVESDMLELIGWEMEGDDGDGSCYSSKQNEYVYNLYHEKLIPFLQSRYQARAAADEWVSVAERLPERDVSLPELRLPNGEVMGPQKHSRRVLVQTRGNLLPTIDYVVEGADGTCVWYLSGISAVVIYWRDFPAPPKQGG